MAKFFKRKSEFSKTVVILDIGIFICYIIANMIMQWIKGYKLFAPCWLIPTPCPFFLIPSSKEGTDFKKGKSADQTCPAVFVFPPAEAE